MVGKTRRSVFKYIPSFIFITSLTLSACGGGQSDTPSPQSSTPVNSVPIQPLVPVVGFDDVTLSAGIGFTVGFDDESKALNNEVSTIFSSGVAAGDYDNDGDIDLFIVRGNLGPNLLYRNDGNMTFTNTAATAGVGIITDSDGKAVRHGAPAFADLDGDGDLDLLLGALFGDQIVVLLNRGDGVFDDVSETAGFTSMTAEFTHSPSFGDYDGDGDLDVIFGHWGTQRDRQAIGDTEHLWRNDSDANGISFRSVSVEAGLSPSMVLNSDPLAEFPGDVRVTDLTFTPSFAFINDDKWLDILMASDLNQSQVFLNNGDGSFHNDTDYGEIIDGNGMGSAVADYDQDGDLDWFVSSIKADNFPPDHLSEIGNRLYRNDVGVFTDITDGAGVSDGGWGWGSCFADFNNDGEIDIYHTNGWFQFDEHGDFSSDSSRVFISNGTGVFTESAQEWGLDDKEIGRGVVCADFDDDGDVDILQLHSNEENAATLWQNKTANDANFLIVDVVGQGANSQAVGASISVKTAERNYYRSVLLNSNFASHNPVRQYFGLGDNVSIESVLVTWPDGSETISNNIQANQTVSIVQ